MISIQDPLSMSHDEKKNLIDRTPYVSATHEEMGIVYNKLSKEIKDPLQSDLLDFLADIWAYNHAYLDSGELWKRFGYNGESQIVLINVEDRYKDVIKFQRYTKTQLISLTNSDNPLNELSKIKRVMSKVIPDAPHEILLVLDGSTGQNAFEQAKKFIESTNVNALAITKLDGTAKGGVVIGVCDQFQIPIKYIGIGEGIDDMKIFDSKNFINSFFN